MTNIAVNESRLPSNATPPLQGLSQGYVLTTIFSLIITVGLLSNSLVVATLAHRKEV